jgi:ABC-2 type transport system permease protein
MSSGGPTGEIYGQNRINAPHRLPDGLRQIAEYNPVSSLAVATRTLFGNPTALPTNAAWTLAHPAASSLAWCAALLAVAVPLTVRRLRAKTMD